MKIYDLHNDFLTELKTNKARSKYLKHGKTNSASDICGAVFTTQMDCEKGFETLEKSYEFIASAGIETPKIHLCVEDLHFVSKVNLDRLINLNPIYCGLVWNNNNALGGGAKEGGDLSLFGEFVARSLEERNIIVDTAHMSEKTFMSFAKITTKPILCSHTASNKLTEHPRNLKDYQLKMIAESGGLVGVALVRDFLTDMKKAEVKDIARHIDYIASHYGTKMVALGTDFYGTKHLPRGINTYSSLIALENRLKIMGYDDKTIEDIFYNNAFEFFSRNNQTHDILDNN